MTEFEKFFCKRTIDCKQGAVRAVRYNVDGSYCLTCGSDKKIKLWNHNKGLLLKTYGGHADEVTDVAGSCDSAYIVSSSLDKSIIYWDVSTGAPVRRLRRHAGGVRCVCFNEDSTIALSGGRDHAVMCWDIRTRSLDPVQTLDQARDCITSVLTNEHMIFTASLDGCVRHYDIRAGQLTCDKLDEPITYMTLTRDEQCLVVACQDGVVRLLDIKATGILNEYKGHKAEDYHIECGITANDSQIVSGTSEGCAIVWDLIEGKVLQRIALEGSHNSVVHSLDTHPNKTELLLAKRRDIYFFTTELEAEE